MNNKWGIPEDTDFDNLEGFIYLILDLETGMGYVGRKNFWSVRRLKPLKGKIRKRKIVKESDWRTYQSSCNKLKSDISKKGVENFTFECLQLCQYKSDMQYYEALNIFKYSTLVRGYNGNIPAVRCPPKSLRQGK